MAGWNYAVLSFQTGRGVDPSAYDLEFTHPSYPGAFDKPPTAFAAIGTLGDVGWELVSAVVTQHNLAVLYFKLHL